ncbi:outer membrane beta-barrel protein [Paracrocinitomix mangrovi]|uniref:outer membrane beta-barrel protein n=1 Tax=Paracrocinitomix mangrovi TaxID=2862509 RepID=UPI001C8E7762|nr:outer membrane beta-barrel protein [Paracrocinitomix mangrovi]UKN00234.1 outer membrane beta-barrel protein [Paracrocinitomix mangrovi]
MKKYLLVFSLLISSFSFSQLHSVGFHVGGMGSSVGKTFWDGDAKIKYSLTGGLNYQYRFTSHLTLGGNLEYTQFGAQVPIEFTDQAGNYVATVYSSYDWNFISIPMMVGFEMGGKFRIKPKVGIVPNILTSMVYNFKPYTGGNLVLKATKTSFYSDANKFDLGSLIGFDMSVPFHSGVVFLGVDFRYSITKLNNDNFFNESLYDTYRNKGLSAVFGVRFSVGKPEVEGPTDIIDDPVK